MRFDYFDLLKICEKDGIIKYQVISSKFCMEYGIIQYCEKNKTAKFYANKNCDWGLDKNSCLELAMILEELEEGKFAE